MVLRVRNVITAALVTGMATTVLTAPALADTRSFADAHGDAKPYMDILKVTVNNATSSADSVRIAVRQRRINYSAGVELLLYIDTRTRHLGPEFFYSVDLVRGGEYGFFRMRSWNRRGKSVDCYDKVQIRRGSESDATVFFIPRSCLDNPGRLRVTARDLHGYPVESQDWAPEARTYYPWVYR
jgi:hypothetical protein